MCALPSTLDDMYNSHEYECPNPDCGKMIEVPDTEDEAVHCKHCNLNLQVNRDADLVDGEWKECTTLSIPERHV